MHSHTSTHAHTELFIKKFGASISHTAHLLARAREHAEVRQCCNSSTTQTHTHTLIHTFRSGVLETCARVRVSVYVIANVCVYENKIGNTQARKYLPEYCVTTCGVHARTLSGDGGRAGGARRCNDIIATMCVQI